ncbi:MAG TPA: type II CAAX endopeptidase family protein [Verrucomicrobiae bacterium]|nr:type II CAAX endopeptidase family protein [Verrucomicrobiae bacterium]
MPGFDTLPQEKKEASFFDRRGTRDRKLVAPLWHTIVLIVYLLATLGWQAHLLHKMSANRLLFSQRLSMYLFMIAFEWLLVGYVWFFGLRPTHTPIREIVGGRWERFSDAFVDIGIAFLFWIAVAIVLIVCRVALGANPAGKRALGILLPRTPIECLLWVLVSISAGICEEFVFRGYLQRQFFALTGNDAAAVALQAIFFGAGHAYQGYRGVITITLYGALFGVLALFRGSLRPGMIQHFLEDSSLILLRYAPKG